MEEVHVGLIKHYFAKIGVAVLEVSGTVKVGDTIHIRGAETDFTQKVASMQSEHNPVEIAKRGESVGLKVDSPVKQHDRVYLVA